jgi:hypothetical protein
MVAGGDDHACRWPSQLARIDVKIPSHKRVVLIGALCLALVAVLCWLALPRRDHALTMQEQLALGHDPEWVKLDLEVPEIAAAVGQARNSLPEFIKRVPRYDSSLEKSLSGAFVGDEREKAQKRYDNARLDAPDGPQFAIRAYFENVPIPGRGMAYPDVWLTHARYDEKEDLFWCLLPEHPPPWFKFWPGCTGEGVRSASVLDWRIITKGRIEGAYTTCALRDYLDQRQPCVRAESANNGWPQSKSPPGSAGPGKIVE